MCLKQSLGGKKIDTKTKQMMNSKANFNERFAMKTILDYDLFHDEYDPKPVFSYLNLHLIVIATTA